MRAVDDGVRALLFPRSLAVVGASPRNVEAVETVVRSGVRAWGVNPNREEVAGLECFPSVAELPEIPETAFLLVNHTRVEQALEDAAAAGVRAFVVPGVGAEAGAAVEAGHRRGSLPARASSAPRSWARTAWAHTSPDGPAAWNGLAPTTTAPGHVAVLCQSGSIADAFLSLGGRVGFRCVVSSGAEAVIDAADYLSFFAEDEGTRAVGLFLETVRRPDAFVEALARCAEARKPVVCLKVGRSESAARAALSHTGALVGSSRAFSAVLRRFGAIEVEDFHELVETLEILGRQPLAHRETHCRDLGVRGRVRTPRRPRRGGRARLRAASLPTSPTGSMRSSRTTSPPGTRSMPGQSTRRSPSIPARSSCSASRAHSTSSSPRPTSRSSATCRTRTGARPRCGRSRAWLASGTSSPPA